MAFTQVNGKVVSTPVAPGREVLARRGAMLAHTGDVGFAPVHMGPGGAGGMLGRMVAGEQVSMMVAQGNGTVYYGYGGLYLTIVVSGSLVMAFGAAVDAPHGGILVLPLLVHPFGFVAALAAGVAVAAALVIVGKSRFRRAAGSAGLRLGEPDEAESR